MRFESIIATGLATAVVSTAPAHAASTTVIDFEGSNYGSNPITSIYDADGFLRGSVSATGGIDEAWIYDTNGSVGRDPDLESPFYDAAQRPDLVNSQNFGNALIVQENRNTDPDDAVGGTLTFTWSKPINIASLTLLDVGSERATISAQGSQTFAQVKNQFNADTNGPDNFYEIVSLDWFGVTELTLDFEGSGAVDNLQVSAVPLPAAFWLFGSVLAASGVIARRKKRF